MVVVTPDSFSLSAETRPRNIIAKTIMTCMRSQTNSDQSQTALEPDPATRCSVAVLSRSNPREVELAIQSKSHFVALRCTPATDLSQRSHNRSLRTMCNHGILNMCLSMALQRVAPTPPRSHQSATLASPRSRPQRTQTRALQEGRQAARLRLQRSRRQIYLGGGHTICADTR